MNCDYCGTFHYDTRCPSCGAPVTRSVTADQVQGDETIRQDFRWSWSGGLPQIMGLKVGGFSIMPPSTKLTGV